MADMANMTGMLEAMLGSQADQIGARIGVPPAQAQSAIAAALPVLMSALGQQAASGPGLSQAIQQDHDGSILDVLPGYLQGTADLSPRTTNGAGILDHVLGDQQQSVQQALSAKTGLSMGTIAQLLPLLAPIVMGMLGKQARSGSGPGLDDLGSLLGGAVGGGGLGDVLGSILGQSQDR